MANNLSDTLFFQIVAAQHRLAAIQQLEKLLPKQDELKKTYTETTRHREDAAKQFEETFRKQRDTFTQDIAKHLSKINELTQEQNQKETELNKINSLVGKHLQGLFSQEEQHRIDSAVMAAVVTWEKQLADKKMEIEQIKADLNAITQQQMECTEKIPQLRAVNEQIESGQLPEDIICEIDTAVKNTEMEYKATLQSLQDSISAKRHCIDELQKEISKTKDSLKQEKEQLRTLMNEVLQKYGNGIWSAICCSFRVTPFVQIDELKESISEKSSQFQDLVQKLLPQRLEKDELSAKLGLHEKKGETITEETEQKELERIVKKYREELENWERKQSKLPEQKQEAESKLRDLTAYIEQTKKQISDTQNTVESDEQEKICKETTYRQQELQDSYNKIVEEIERHKKELSEFEQKILMLNESYVQELDRFVVDLRKEEKQAETEYRAVVSHVEKMRIAGGLETWVVESVEALQKVKEQYQALLPKNNF